MATLPHAGAVVEGEGGLASPPATECVIGKLEAALPGLRAHVKASFAAGPLIAPDRQSRKCHQIY